MALKLGTTDKYLDEDLLQRARKVFESYQSLRGPARALSPRPTLSYLVDQNDQMARSSKFLNQNAGNILSDNAATATLLELLGRWLVNTSREKPLPPARPKKRPNLTLADDCDSMVRKLPKLVSLSIWSRMTSYCSDRLPDVTACPKHSRTRIKVILFAAIELSAVSRQGNEATAIRKNVERLFLSLLR